MLVQSLERLDFAPFLKKAIPGLLLSKLRLKNATLILTCEPSGKKPLPNEASVLSLFAYCLVYK
jgi:hypothetical protein